MALARTAVELARTLRGPAGHPDPPAARRLWLALPGGDLAEREALLALIATR